MHTGFDFADIYDEVVSRAGGEMSTAEDTLRVRRGLRILLERWEQQGYNTWRIATMSATASGQSSGIKLDVCVDDVVNIIPSDGGTLTRISYDRYMEIPDKTTQGRPGQYALFRSEPPVLRLFPTGRPASPDRLEIWYVKRPAAFDLTSDLTSDVPGRWLEAMILGLAHDLACKRPGPEGYNEPLISRLDAQRLRAEDICTRADRDRSNYRYRMA